MTVKSINDFVESIQNGSKDILYIDMIASYGITCSGSGIFGFYKEEIHFNQQN